MKKVLFIKNALILTVTALILRVIGMVFRVWLAGSIGAEGMGLYQVIFSVYILASTFATSGISTAVTRLVTERLAAGDKGSTGRILRLSSFLTLVVAAVTSIIIIIFSAPISKYLIGDMRAILSVRILCLGLPFMGVCSCFRGYFLARRSTLPPSISQIAEQIVRMLVIVFLVGKYASKGLTYTSAAVLLGDAVAEGMGCLLIWLFFKLDFRKIRQKSANSLKKRTIFSEIFRISLPISGGRYLHTALRTAESLITPNCLAKYSGTKTAALEQFGMIKGMALPILLFPASLLSAVSTLLIPEITQSVAEKNNLSVQSAVEKVFRITAFSSFLIGGIFFALAGPLGVVVYSSGSVGYLIKALAPLVPFMYIDLIADGILKGLDEQTFLFKSNVFDSLVRVVLVFLLVPKFGMTGFLGVMIFSNLFTSVVSVIRILKTTKTKFSFKNNFFNPLVSVMLASFISNQICLSVKNYNILYIILVVISISVLYLTFMILLGCVDLNNIKPKLGLFRGKKSKTV